MPTNFTKAEEAVLKRALEHVLSNATFAESMDVLGSEETHLFRKFNIDPHRALSPDYVLRMSAKEMATLGLVMLAGFAKFPELYEDLQGVMASVEAQAKKRIHDKKERAEAQGREEFASAAQARSFA